MTLVNQRYRILHSIGRGGFGETFLVEDTHMPSSRRCVLKQLKPRTTDAKTTQLVRERFAREAATLESLGEAHPQIPTLYAYFTEGDQFYLVQEWIEGQTLTERVRSRGKLSDTEVRRLLSDLLPVLEFVHSRGIVHRDIKPDNIIVRDRDGLPVPIDFGAVRETMGTVVSSSGHPTSSIVIGTPGFMSGEQAVGRPMYSSDLYSLGLTAIFALTGKYPQEIPSDPRTGKLLWFEDVRVEDGLKRVLDKAIEPHPRDRFATVREMSAALQSPETVLQTPPPPSTEATVAVVPRGERSTAPSTVAATTAVPDPPAKSSNATKLLFGAIVGGIVGGSVIATMAVRQSQRSDVTVVPTPTPTVEATPTPTVEATPIPEERGFYFLADSAYADRDNADKRLSALRDAGYNTAGSFWLPDYPNLSNKPYQQVYVDRFETRDACVEQLQAYGRDYPDSYCAFASTNPNTADERIAASEVVVVETPQETPQVPSDRPSPIDAARDYYAAINANDLIVAWNTLSRELQQDEGLHPKGFRDYQNWWDTVNAVRVEELRLVEVGEETARVDVRLKYFMKSGETGADALRITWIWDRYNDRWVYDDAIKF
ncbi:serine/threonine kinase [Geitlerinema sp. FC II]|nr:serine/threonine kinase [Geitlerinema sp. FC II]